MPWIYPSAVTKAILFLGRQNEVGIPLTIQDHAAKAVLADYIAESDDSDDFWDAAELDNDNWRKAYMARKPRTEYPTMEGPAVTRLIDALAEMYVVDLTADQSNQGKR